MGLKVDAEAGLEFEIVTKSDLVNALHEVNRSKAEVIWEGNNFSTDASGNANNFVYTCPVGKVLRLQRLIVWADGATNPHAPHSAGWWALLSEGPNFMAGNIVEFAPSPQQTQELPWINDYGYHDAPVWYGGSDVWFYGQSLIASTNISVNFQALLEPAGERNYNVSPFRRDHDNNVELRTRGRR